MPIYGGQADKAQLVLVSPYYLRPIFFTPTVRAEEENGRPRPVGVFGMSTSRMRAIAARLSPYVWRTPINLQPRRFSTSSFGRDERSIEQDAERKVGWLLKLIFAGTATLIGYQIFPYMGDNLVQQSVSLLEVKDPLFKRMGASRLARFAVDDERRMKIVEIGGAGQLLNMLESARDDRTRKEALKALFAISKSDEAAVVLHQAGAISIIKSTLESAEDAEVGKYKSNLLSRFQDLSYDIRS